MPGLIAATSSAPAAAPAFPPTTPSPSRPQHHADPAAVLTFADVSDELFRLQPIDGQNTAAAAPQHPPPHQLRSSSSNSSLTAQPQAAASHSPHTRRPSPGLAARLKALGFGTSRKASPPPTHRDRVGRLPEDQLRQLEQSHQSASAPVVERRGRPWKGAIARIPSRASLKSSKSVKTHDDELEEPLPKIPPAGAPDTRPPSEFLPAIEPSTPFDMDTHKYRLPDHTNGNGTKAMMDTRREHLERDSRRPSTPELQPPPPPPKDSPRPATAAAAAPPPPEADPDPSSYFNPLGLQRPGSIYTISRASFAVQLAQLTSLQLPDAESLSSKVAAIPTAQAAARALIGAAEQIRSWIYKASEVIGGLDSEDDVEWAAAGGREGLEEVEQAIARFEELINAYVSAIEDLQRRDDIASVPTDDLTKAVVQMEAIIDEWSKIRATLQTVKGQVEIAMEWEELWNMVLGDIQNEMDDLTRLVFEMEERRHKSVMAIASGEGVDIGDLETIVEEAPPAAARLQANNRFSLPVFPVSPGPSSPGPVISQDDSSLLALFARMQPLRASLDFLPMRLSVFEARAQKSFPTACEELEMRRVGLDASYKKLEKDAESLRKELGEDRWVLVFRGAGRQAQKMVESVERAVAKLREAVDAGTHLTNQPVMAKKIESYEAKKTHYGPAIERVLSIIDRGVKDRLTVNGEILRLHGELQTRWEDVKGQLRDMDAALEELQAEKKGQQLRDSVSSMLSNDRSTSGSGAETPGSSPPSSVIMASLGLERAKPAAKTTRGRVSSGTGTHLPQPPISRRAVSATSSSLPRKPVSRLSSGVTSPSREGSATPTGHRGGIPRPASTVPGRPRWNASTNTTDIDTGHNFKPLSATDRSPYAKTTPTPARSSSSLSRGAPPSASSKLPTRSPGLRAASSSPSREDPTPSKHFNRLSFRERMGSPGPPPSALPKARLGSTASSLSDRRASLQPPKPSSSVSSLEDSSRAAPPRPASSLASSSSRRLSMLPQPRHSRREGSSVTGRESPQAVAGARAALQKSSSSASRGGEPKDGKPRWRA